MRGEGRRQVVVHRLQFELVSLRIPRIVALAAFDASEIQDEERLEEFAAVVLEDVADTVSRRQFLIAANRREEIVEPFLVGVVIPAGGGGGGRGARVRGIKSPGSTSSADARRSRESSRTERLSRSIRLMCVM